MPVQRTLLGKPVAFQIPPRRFLVVFGLAITIVLLIVASFSSHVQDAAPVVSKVSQSISEHAHHAVNVIPRPKIPKLYNPLAEISHEPPDQEHSNRGNVRWYNDLKWLNPFSSSITLNSERAVLPPLATRTPIYTFYEGSKEKKSEVVSAENELILTWRRAWWAQGFKPVVLGRPEALKHPLYERMSKMGLESGVIKQLERWLAWAHMGGGIMANWLTLPMGPHDSRLLAFLRNGTFDDLLMFQDQKDGLYAGKSAALDAVIKQLIDDDTFKKATDLSTVLPRSAFKIDKRVEHIAYYSLPTITSKYAGVADELSKSQAAGLKALRQLINAHLHNAWTGSFSEGVAVLKPAAKHMNIVTAQALKIANILAICPETPMATSCPPNNPSCRPCNPGRRLHITTSETFANRSSIFTIGTVPHPVTFSSLHYNRDDLDTRFVRRKTTRDLWLRETTEQLLGKIISGPQRLVKFKEAVASEFGAAHTFWMTAEREEFNDLDWIFGFELSALKLTDEELFQPVKLAAGPAGLDGSEPSHRLTDHLGNMRATDAELAREHELMDKARTTLKSSRREDKPTVERVEAWSMADTEAWRFVKAFGMRRQVEREQWEQDERKFMGSRTKASGFGGGFLG